MADSKQFDWERFAQVQAELPKVGKEGQGNYGSYMKLEDMNPAILKVLNKHGFVWITMPSVANGSRTLQYRLVDTKSGQSIDGEMDLVMAQDSPQAQGSALTYARRYSLAAVVGLVADMDDDGEQAESVAQQKIIEDRMATSPIAIRGFYATLKSRGVEDKEEAHAILSEIDPKWQKLNTSGIARVQKQLEKLMPDTIRAILEGDNEAPYASDQY